MSCLNNVTCTFITSCAHINPVLNLKVRDASLHTQYGPSNVCEACEARVQVERRWPMPPMGWHKKNSVHRHCISCLGQCLGNKSKAQINSLTCLGLLPFNKAWPKDRRHEWQHNLKPIQLSLFKFFLFKLVFYNLVIVAKSHNA